MDVKVRMEPVRSPDGTLLGYHVPKQFIPAPTQGKIVSQQKEVEHKIEQIDTREQAPTGCTFCLGSGSGLYCGDKCPKCGGLVAWETDTPFKGTIYPEGV